ncbi:DUF3108 domain-containing protein [Amphritea opalescens]|uniref:DUF3108 domain-containing protein n=1 Tax=Amphritea opalescens TaxID=2490544 RepID=A0A430KSH1_9GAMM|nr:DUF3108 domain-containing protein [Amphritea opalescens]RTE66449.1 DUF3108 domain-containing protein [Amphritea opalescens]
MRLSTLLISTLLLACTLPTQASEILKPYKAIYKAQWDVGISFGGDAISELTRTGDRWKRSLRATALIAKVDEFTEFTLQGQNVLPQHYEYHRKVIGNNKNAVLQFNWNTGSVLNDIAKKPWTMDILPGTQDKLSYQIQMRLDLAAGKTELSYQVADGGKTKTYPFIIVGKENVTTGIGSFEAIKIQRDRGPDSNRETFLWCAPELGYMVVKLQQVEKSGKKYSLLIDKLEFMEP